MSTVASPVRGGVGSQQLVGAVAMADDALRDLRRAEDPVFPQIAAAAVVVGGAEENHRAQSAARSSR
jgi:hypothetical protein